MIAIEPGTTWRKSSYSAGNGACIEVGWTEPTLVAVRDSKNATGPTLAFAPSIWREFLARKA